jgi:hypothetical protein
MAPPACQRAGEVWRVPGAFRWWFGEDQRANGAVRDVIGSREIAAGGGPAHRNEKVGTITRCLAHDVSTLLGGHCQA